jgi:tousled-like kinase
MGTSYPTIADFLTRSKSPSEVPSDASNQAEAIRPSSSSPTDDEHPCSTAAQTTSVTTPVVSAQVDTSSLSAIDEIRMKTERLELEQRLEELEDQCRHYENQISKREIDHKLQHTRAEKTIITLLVDAAKRENSEVRRKLIADQERLGKFVSASVHMPGISSGRSGYWDGGSEEESINMAVAQLEIDRAEIEREKAMTRKVKSAKPLMITFTNSSSAGGSGSFDPSPFDPTVSRQLTDLTETEHLLNDTSVGVAMQESNAKRADEQIRERQRKLHVERILYMKQLKTYRAQEESTFNQYPILGGRRYQVLNMLGKGGFSEVYKAYDLHTHQYVALKIHEIRKEMEESARQNYVRHTTQEYNIHKKLVHRRIIRVHECFSINALSFGVAMEYSEGVDLDTYLKAHGPMGEKEARGVITQVLSALRHMNTPPHKIIHYDLKPGNILFDKGQVKIADFGLSKIVDHAVTNGHDTIELTSQGAGTYYYLPPECFGAGAAAMKVSNKVDVWSVGVVFYELLFGRKPFGDGQSQENILRSASTIFNPHMELQFPGKISKQAEEFIRRLLTHDVRRRPDVIEASNDPYVFPAAAAIGAGVVAVNPK